MFTKSILLKPFWGLISSFLIILIYHILQHLYVENNEHAAVHDTSSAQELYSKGEFLLQKAKYDSSIFYFEKASVIYENEKNWLKYINCFNHIADNLIEKAVYDTAMEFLEKALEVDLEVSTATHPVIAQSYHQIGKICLIKGEYDKAFDYYNKALDIRLETLGASHPAVASSYTGLGNYYYTTDDYQKAHEYYEKALGIRCETLGEYHPHVAGSYDDLGNIFYLKGNYDKACEYYEKALGIRRETFGEYHPDVAGSYDDLGNISCIKANYDKALEHYEKAIYIRLKTFDKNHFSFASSYTGLGNVYYYQNNFKKALAYYQKTLRIYLERYSENHPEVANACTNLGNVYYLKADYEKALEYYRQSLDIYTQAFSEKHPDVAFAYEHLGLVHHGKGDYPKAFEYYHKALIIYDQTPSYNSDEIATIYSYIGNIYNKNGDYNQAFHYLNKALTTLSNKFGDCNAEVVWINYDLGDIFLNKSDYEQALSYFNKGLSLSLKMKNYNFVAHGYSKIGHVYLKQNDYERALKFFNKDLSINLDLFGEGHPSVAESYNKIGNIYFNKDQYVEALEFYNKALINFKKYGENHPDIAKVLQDIGKVYYMRDDFKRALFYYQKSLNSLIPDFQEDNIYINPSLTKIYSEPILLAGLELKAEAFEKFYSKSSHLKDLQQSLSTYELVTKLIDEMRRGYNAEQTKLFLGEKTYNVYNNAISTAIKLYEITKNDQYKEKAFLFSEKSKTNLLLESLAENKAKQFARIPETLLEHERQVKIDIAFYQKSISEEQARGDKADNSKIILWQDKLFAYRQEYQKLIDNYQEKYPEYYDLKYQVKTTSPQELQNEILDEDSALVEYFIGEGSIWIFTITKKDFAITEVKIDSSFAGQIKTMRTGLLNGDYDLYTKHAYQLYQTLIEPVKNKLQNRKLFIIPDGILGYIPFETLITEKPATSKDYRQLSYLINDYQITYSYSSTLLLETMKTEKTKGNSEIIGFAPVVFN